MNLNKNTKGPQSGHAATAIQKTWRGHAVRTNDDRVQDLKEEVKSLRTDQHIRHLTKELSAAKLALERERKLRSLQMDAIKVIIIFPYPMTFGTQEPYLELDGDGLVVSMPAFYTDDPRSKPAEVYSGLLARIWNQKNT